MGLRSQLSRLGRIVGGEPHADGQAELHIGDPRYDQWEVVRDFAELEAARAFRQTLTEAGLESVLTSDWPLDRFGRGDIALRVQPGDWSRAEELLSAPE